MRSTTVLFLSLLVGYGCSACDGAASTTPTSTTPTSTTPTPVEPSAVAPPAVTDGDLFATATNAFAVDFWKHVGAQDGNLAVSPASIQLALAMTWGGAEGNTAEQMADVMHFGDDADAFHAAAGQVLATWNDTERETYQLAVANRLFGERGYPWQEAFLALTKDAYGAPLEQVSFSAVEPTRTRINDWVASKTNDRIQDLIPRGGIDSDTRMVLVNAIYFLADWQHPFEKQSTRPQKFHATGGAKQVPMMHQQARFSYAETDDVQILEMPYKGGDLAMMVVLPRENDGLATTEAKLSAAGIAGWVDAMKPREVKVSMPKYRVDPPASLSLGSILQAMGMTDAFGAKADFSAMAASNELFISDVFHKAFVAVDEKGTEAAAATAVVMTEEAAMRPPPGAVAFTADHPFLFFIRDTRSGAILFMGRVADPTA